MIERAVRCGPGARTDIAGDLWDSLAAALGVLIGERGFASLYIRSLYSASAAFPWMVHPLKSVSGDTFKLVKFSLDTSDEAETHSANAALLNIFTDTLILLIGETLTNNILRDAWGDDVVDHVGTEP